MKTVFILDDERAILDLISKYLTKEGYSVETFLNAEDLLKRIEIKMPDMFVLDIIFAGGMDGWNYPTFKDRDNNSHYLYLPRVRAGSDLGS